MFQVNSALQMSFQISFELWEGWQFSDNDGDAVQDSPFENYTKRVM